MNGKGELVVHIGPPKTATTALQYFFQNLKHPEISYGGIHQPRKDNKDSIIKELRYAILVKDRTLDKAIDRIAKLLDNGVSVFLSDEYFLVESDKISVQNKLQGLLTFLEKFNPKILFFVRDPKEVIGSYFVEMYNGITIHKIDSFAKSTYCDVYKYKSLREKIWDIGFERVAILNYDKLIQGEYTLSDIFPSIIRMEKYV